MHMITNKTKGMGLPCLLVIKRAIVAHKDCKKAIGIYFAILLVLSFFLGINFDGDRHIYVEGQIAEEDVIADRNIFIEDAVATDNRRKQIMLLQPQIYDFSMESYVSFEEHLMNLMREMNGNAIKPGQESPTLYFSTNVEPDLAKEILPEFSRSSLQTFVLKQLIPLMREKLALGVVNDFRSSHVGSSGVIIRNIDTKTEVIRPDVSVLPDVQSLLTELSTIVRADETLSNNSKRAINIILATYMPVTLSLNKAETKKRAIEVADRVDKVYCQIQKGELFVHRGDRVTREQQLAMQTLFQNRVDLLNWKRSLGVFVIAVFISLGFFLSPSGKAGSYLRSKDLSLISGVLIITTIFAKGIFVLCSTNPLLSICAPIAFPVAGAVSFVSMIFVARRYVSLGLLLSFFCTVSMHMGIELLVFHFLTAMLAIWLVSATISREEVVRSIIPLFIGECILMLGISVLMAISMNQVLGVVISIAINTILTLFIFFAMSPFLEALFGYSTKFRLMEFMSLEQPLMQRIMVTIPGTYHHSIVVATMVEAAAKEIGANTLLCKVAALYHDAGKLDYPLYFVENLFGQPNKHDRLAPSMSALIILSHVKKGAELCTEYKLGKEVVDIITQHHGTRIVRFFYQKAVKLGENPSESDYSYNGPKPQTKEAAILMLADSVEASSRTIVDPTPAKLKTHIDKIIMGIFSEGQLDEVELTFKDLHLISESFHRVLAGLFHQRIDYPEQAKNARLNAMQASSSHSQEENKEARPTLSPIGTAMSGYVQKGVPLSAMGLSTSMQTLPVEKNPSLCLDNLEEKKEKEEGREKDG